MTEIRNLYEEEREQNKVLTERWNLRFLAINERISLYDDVESITSGLQ
jgi:hypothetical protein